MLARSAHAEKNSKIFLDSGSDAGNDVWDPRPACGETERLELEPKAEQRQTEGRKELGLQRCRSACGSLAICRLGDLQDLPRGSRRRLRKGPSLEDYAGQASG